MIIKLGLIAAFPLLSLAVPQLDRRAVTCLEIGQTATAKWTDSQGRECTFVGIVGSNYGSNPFGLGE